MSATSPLGAIGALAMALAIASLLGRRFSTSASSGRHLPLDGLRGYAAFFVFVHHAAAWYFFVRSGVWAPPPSRLYTHFGQSSVAIFFMLTGFLFWSKLLDARTRPLDWRRFYVSRVLRIAPLYVCAVGMLWVIALATSGFVLRVSPARAVLDTLEWLTFTAAGMPDLNHAPTSIIGGSAWSLPYEWWFYLSLPAAAWLLRGRPSPGWLIVGLAGTVAGALWVSDRAGWIVASAFLGGIASAYLVRLPALCALARYPAASIVCIAALAAAIRSPGGLAPAPLALLSLVFAIVACGNTLFGVLAWRPARVLGEISYSIYLLHGIVLFLLLGVVVGTARLAALSPAAHWLLVIGCVPVLLATCQMTFRTIEAPAMAAVDRVTRWLGPPADGRPLREPADRRV